METNAQVILNNLDALNKNVIDWSYLGCIAIAYMNNINIIDATNLKLLKTLSQKNSSKSPIINLKWSTCNLNSNKNIYPSLASAIDDLIYIWDINESRIVAELNSNENNQSNSSNQSNKVIDMKWLSSAQTTNKNNNSNTLISLYSNSKLIIWNTESAGRIWQKNLSEQKLQAFALDQHDFLRIAFLGPSFINFLKLETTGDSNFVEKWQRKFYLASNDASMQFDSNVESPKRSSINLFTSYWKKSADPKPSSSQTTLQKTMLKECIQIEFHPFVKNVLFLVYPREIFVFDLIVNQTINFIQTDKMFSSYQKIYPCHQADVFYAVHENGSLSVHCRFSDSNNQYELIANTEQKRLPKNSNVFGLSVCPNSEKFCSIILSDGRLLKYELFGKKEKSTDKSDMFLFEIIDSKKKLKLMLVSMSDSISSNYFVIKMGPRLTKKNCKFWYPMMAFGDLNGYLSIYNLNSNKIDRKIALTTNPIMGIEWISLHSLITWSFNSNMSSGLIDSLNNQQNKQQTLVKNDIFYVDLRTGESVGIRKNQNEESSISAIRISNLKQYMVILFKDHPFEIWDLRNFSLIKKISRRSPIITILEWCPNDFNKKIDENLKTDGLDGSNKQNSSIEKSERDNQLKHDQKESLICIDYTGLMYSFCVESNHIKDGPIVLPEDGALSNISSIDLKKDFIIFGDLEGNLSRWNCRTKYLKAICYKRGMEIKKIKFAPGKENMLLLVHYNELIQIYDMNNLDLFSEFRSKIKILDSNWCSPDKLYIQFSDFCVKVFDVNFNINFDYNQLMAPNLFNLEQKETNLFKLKTLIFDCLYRNKLEELSQDLNFSKLMDIFKTNLQSCNQNLIDRYAYTSALINVNGFETKFWTLFSYLCETQKSSDQRKFRKLLGHNSLMVNSSEFRSKEIDMLHLYRDKIESQQINSVLKEFIMSNELDSAFNFLMESDPVNENYTNNLIKACLIASIKDSSENSQAKTSIKLVATSLIANGKIYDGVELLCLIGLIFDACRYLQDNNEWEKAAWLAKVRLNENEQQEIIKRWSDYLISSTINRKESAILLLLSCKAYWKVLDLLADTNYIQLTYIFFHHMVSNNIINLIENFQIDQEKDLAEQIFNRIEQIDNETHQKTVRKIITNFLEFKKLLKF